MVWKQAQEWFPVFPSYEGSGAGFLGITEDEEDGAVELSILTRMSSQTLHGWILLLSTTWIWFGMISITV